MKTSKKCEILLLPNTGIFSTIWWSIEGFIIHSPLISKAKSVYQPYNLFIVSDDPINVGDLYTKNMSVLIYKKDVILNGSERKIIAATENIDNVCKIPGSLIDQYVAAFNKGFPINEIMVEYDDDTIIHIDNIISVELINS